MKIHYNIFKIKNVTLALLIVNIFAAHAAIDTVKVRNFSFAPNNLTISLGDSILWEWESGFHTTTSLGIPVGASSWDNPMTSSNTTFLYVPTVVGTYNYKCTPHFPNMVASFTVCANSSSTITQNACNSLTINNITYTSTGVYTQTIPNNGGCDSIITINARIDSLTNSITQMADTLMATNSSINYLWVNCDSNFASKPADTNQFFVPTSSGNYALISSNGSCVDTSNCFNVIITHIEKLRFSNKISIFPNPSKGQLKIETDQTFVNAQLSIYNVLGKIVLKEEQLNGLNFSFQLDKLENGLYLIEIKNENEIYQSKFLKE